MLEGAFSFVLVDATHLVGVRDPAGLRPLCLGRLGPAEAPEGWVLGSETPALDIVGATFVREIEPGEMVVVDSKGVRSEQLFAPERIDPHLCIFEFVYFARPDSRLYGREVHSARRRMGELLAGAGAGRRRSRHGRARVGGARRRGLRPGQRDPPRPGPGEEPLHRPDLHHPGPGRPRRRCPAQAQPAAGEHRRSADHRRRRLHRAGHDPAGRGPDAARSRRASRSTCGSPPRRWPGPASTGSTSPTATSSRRPSTPCPRSPSS